MEKIYKINKTNIFSFYVRIGNLSPLSPNVTPLVTNFSLKCQRNVNEVWLLT
jgi:hypothetical protein